MKRILAIISMCGVLLSCGGNEDKWQQRETELNNMAAQCTWLSTNLNSLKEIVAAQQNGEKIASLEILPNAAGEYMGYLFKFEDGDAVTLHNAPAYVTVGLQDGRYCWMTNGTAVSDVLSGNVPRFKLEDGVQKMSLDGGATWTGLAQEDGQMVSSVVEESNCVEIIMASDARICIPKVDELQVELIAEHKSYSPGEVEYVQYRVSGAEGKAVDVELYASDGWKADLFKTSDTEGYVKVVAPEDAGTPSVVLFVSTDGGKTLAAALDLANASQAPDSPVFSSLVDVISIGCAGGDIEVKVSTNLDYEIITDSDWVVCRQTKAVREDVIAFEVLANNSEDARNCVITFKSGNYYTSCCVMQEADYGEIDNEPQTPVDSDLSKNGTANCYIVNAEGTYSFNASVIGNGAAGIIEGARFHVEEEDVAFKPVKAEVQWIENECIRNVKLDKSTGVISFTATGSKGNALIAVYDDWGDIAWSWHIWCTNMPKDVTVSNAYGKQFILMDRNLGATSINPNEVEKTHGLFYQWGRKDPFIPSKDLKSTIERNPTNDIYGAVMNPTVPFRMLTSTYEWYGGTLSRIEHALWGNPDYNEVHPVAEYAKSIYDPCPVGYMVPPQDTWAGLAESDLQFVPAGFFQLLDGGKKVFYPYSGYCDQGNVDGKDCGYSGYYRYVAEGTRDRFWFCRLWTSATGLYSGKYMGGQQMLVQHDPEEEYANVVAGSTGDMRGRMVPVRCVKME